MDVTEHPVSSGMQGTPPSAGSNYDPRGETSGQTAQAWQRGPLKNVSTAQLARALGWFSIGLGLAEIFVPRTVARICGGTGKHTGLIRLYGVREIFAGLMIFSEGRKPAKAVWSRVAGDAVDLATLAAAAVSPRTNKAGVLFGAANVLAVTALDWWCAQELSREKGAMTVDGAVCVKRSIAVNRSPEEIYRYWRDLQNLPRFMYHLKSVEVLDERRSRWTTSAPGGTTIEWDSEITEDRPNETIAWQSTQGAVENRGSVRFEPRPGGRGSIVRVDLEYRPPGGPAGTALAMLFNQAPEQQLTDDLRRLKQVLETGEVVRSDGSPEGTGSVLQRAARPA